MSGQWKISACSDTDLLWKEYFRDPSQWWDFQSSKVNPNSADFKHKTTKELLWIHGLDNPSWVHEELKRQHVNYGEEIRQKTREGDNNSKGNYERFQEDTALVALLKACAKQKDLLTGSRVHADVLRDGLLKTNIYIGTALVNMYAKCGALAKAQEVFDQLPVQDVISWSTLIAGYAQHGRGTEALECLDQMQAEGLSPDAITFTCILKACGSIGATKKGEEIHGEIARRGLLDKSVELGTALVDMYGRCGMLAKAQEMFDELPIRNVVSWNALITAYVQHGNSGEALNCFELMQDEGFSPNAVTFSCILKACGSIGAVEKGKKIHADAVRTGLLEKSVTLGNALVDMYAKCGALAKAQELFDELPDRDIVSWNALIAGYAQQGQSEKALNCFDEMQSEGFSPDTVTCICIMKACSNVGGGEKVKEIHAEVVRQGLLEQSNMLGNALIDMYAKRGALVKALEVFDKLPVRDVVSWNALIAGYAQHGHGREVLNFSEWMQREGQLPDALTFTCILKACGCLGAAEKGEEIHAEVVRQGLLEKSIILGNALVDMYGKCGELTKGQDVFNELPARDTVSWNVLIAGYAQHGYGDEAVTCFERMQDEGVFPDAITFTVLLNACNHSGLVDEGEMYYAVMSTGYGIIPTIEHHTCMVDLFGRAGYLDKAIGVIEKVSPSDCLPLWFALLGACQMLGNVKIGELAFEHIVQLDEKDDGAYICMSNIYAAAGMQAEVDKVEAMRVKK